jgi:hypothetical protein
VTFRLAYGFLIVLLVTLLAVAMGLRSVPFWQTRMRYEPVAIDGTKFAIAWALDRGATQYDELRYLPVGVGHAIHFSFPYVNQEEQVEDRALAVLVKEKLPADSSYVVHLRGVEDSITLPLRRRDDGTYASTVFIALEDAKGSRYFHGVRVFHIHDGACSLSVEKVVQLGSN